MTSPFPAVYTTKGYVEIVAKWNDVVLEEAMTFMEDMTAGMIAQGKKYTMGMTTCVGGSIDDLTEEQFYALMACMRRLYRIKYRIGFDYEVKSKKRCVGQKKTTPSSTLRYKWSYTLSYACFTDEQWAECKCECHDGDCLDMAVEVIHIIEEEENPI